MNALRFIARFVSAHATGGGWHPVSFRIVVAEAFCELARRIERALVGDGWWP